MVIFHGTKITNIVILVTKMTKVLVQRDKKYDFDRHCMVYTDSLQMVIHYRDDKKLKGNRHEWSSVLYEWSNDDDEWKLYALAPGDVIQHNGTRITIPDISKLERDDQKEFACEKLTNDLMTLVTLEKNLS